MITAIIASIFIGLLVGLVVGAALNSDPFPMNLEDFEREKRYRAENEANRLYLELEALRRQNLRLSSYPLYQTRDPLLFEIQKIPRVQSPEEAEQKYGAYWKITDGLIGKINEVISEVNSPTIKKF